MLRNVAFKMYYLCLLVFPKLEIFKILYFLLFDKTLAVKVLVLNNLDYKVFCKVIASFNDPVKLWGWKIGIFVFLMTCKCEGLE